MIENKTIHMHRYAVLFIPVFLLLYPGTLFSQEEIQREVRVVKPYTPTLSDAEKISLLPVMEDTGRSNPTFVYRIYPRRYDTHFTLNPIQPARMVGQPLEKIYKTQFTLGAGNYLSPFAELTVNSLRDKRSSIGLYAMHHSSGGKVKLDNGKKVDAPYSDNLLELQARRINFRSVLEGTVSGGYNSNLFYGYSPALDTVLLKDSIRQRIYSAGAGLKFYSTHPDSSHLHYTSAFNYQLTADAYSNMEHYLSLRGSFAGFISDFYSGLETSVDNYVHSDSVETDNHLIIRVNPYISKKTSEWKFLVGLNTALDVRNETGFRIYPRALFEFSIVPDVLIPYMGVDGYRMANSYRDVVTENPYIVPGLRASPTDLALIGYFGMKGRYSSKMSFDLKVSYSRMDSMLMFMNDTLSDLRNRFIPAYDDATMLRFGAEVIWTQSEKLKLMLRGHYSDYNMTSLAYAWHKPAFKTSFSARYNLRDKVLLNTDLFFVGKRYAHSGPGPDDARELSAFADLNLGIEYRYTKMLSFWLKFSNLAGMGYETWNYYPVQRFQLMGGFSYAL